mgnify:CR=1 FL=1
MKWLTRLIFLLALFPQLNIAQAQAKLKAPDYLLRLDSKKDFDLMKGEPLSKNFNGIECVKIIYEIQSKTLYYANSRRYLWHYPFVKKVLNDPDAQADEHGERPLVIPFLDGVTEQPAADRTEGDEDDSDDEQRFVHTAGGKSVEYPAVFQPQQHKRQDAEGDHDPVNDVLGPLGLLLQFGVGLVHAAHRTKQPPG